MNARLFLALLSLVALPGRPFARAEETTVRVNMVPETESLIRFTAAVDSAPSFGFVPVLVQIENRAGEERSWEVSFTYSIPPPQVAAGVRQPNSVSLGERFTAAPNSTFEKVVFVPTGGAFSYAPSLRIRTRGPDVQSEYQMLSAAPARTSANLLAVTPALGSTMSTLHDFKMRAVAFTSRTGELQTRRIPEGSYGAFTLSDGGVVTVPDHGEATLVQGPGAKAPTVLKTTPLGDVSIETPPAVYVNSSETRLKASAAPRMKARQPGDLRKVVVMGPAQPPRTLYVPYGRTLAVSFDNGSTIQVPFAGPPRISTSGRGIGYSVDAEDQVSVTLPASVRVQKAEQQTAPSTAGGSFTPGFVPTASSTPPSSLAQQLSEVDPLRWPADPRVWSLFSMVVMEKQEWEHLDDARRVALRDWVALGGVLVLSPTESSAARRIEDHGAGKFAFLEKSVKECTREDFLNLGLSEANRHPAPWLALSGELLTQTDFALAASDENHTGVILILFLFACAAGPLTVFKLAPAEKRQRVFVVIPVLCLGTSFLLAAFILFRDGIGGTGTRSALVVLLPEDKRAVIFQQQVSRTGTLLGKSFKLPADVLLVRDELPAKYQNEGVASQWSAGRSGDEAFGEWFSIRSQQAHQLRKLASTRARVELAKAQEGAEPAVRSTLATNLTDFVYADEKGVLWAADTVTPGALVKLKRVSEAVGPAKRWGEAAKKHPGWFFASGGPSDLAPLDTLESIRWKNDRIAYAGRLANAEEVKP